MIIGEAATSSTCYRVDDVLSALVTGTDEDPTQTESGVRVDSVPDGLGHVRQPGHGQIKNSPGKHLGARSQITQSRFLTPL